jgi:hypothetical protein
MKRAAIAAALALAVAAGCTQADVTREANKQVTGGPEITQDALAYAKENLSFKLESAIPHGNDITMLVGTVKNKGPQAVAYLKVAVVLQDEKGQPMGSDTDFVAHKLPFGENKTPIPAKGSRPFTVKIKDVKPGWKLEKTQITILEAALK